MLTIDHADHITINVTGAGGSSILSEAIAAALKPAEAHVARQFDELDKRVQTSASTPPALGEIWPGEGGRFAGTMPPRDGKPGYHLIVAGTQEVIYQRLDAPRPTTAGQAAVLERNLKWGPYDNEVQGAGDHADGLANTLALMEASGAGVEFPAAQWADSIEVHELSDYYLPAHNELMLMWINVPHLFQKSGYYWSSTQYSPDYAWVQDFENGYSYFGYKSYEFRAVAVRRLVL